jgi:hypothetical protein
LFPRTCWIKSPLPPRSASVAFGEAQSGCGKLSDISVNRDIWPVLSEHGLAIGIDLAEGDGSHSGSFEAEAEAADSAEKVEDIHKTPAKRGLLPRK